MTKYIEPALYVSAFNCPHCHVLANQTRFEFNLVRGNQDNEEWFHFSDYEVTKCDGCSKPTLWLKNEIEYPTACVAPEAVDAMPNELKDDFEEARKVLNASPRASAALLRLVVQKLCDIVGEPGTGINENIGVMVKKGLPSEMQQMLDIVRVSGNESVHPGEMNLKDDRETALLLFNIVNRIIERLIIEPAKFEALYNSLPASKLKGIANRDK